jgi:hypothetical protein
MIEVLEKNEMPGYIAAALTGIVGSTILLRCDWTRKPNGKLRFWPFFFGLFFISSAARAVVSEVTRRFHF